MPVKKRYRDIAASPHSYAVANGLAEIGAKLPRHGEWVARHSVIRKGDDVVTSDCVASFCFPPFRFDQPDAAL
jgi:hypothetical protein